METIPNEDVLRKIRKLLALSESSNPNEAANAAAKARKMLLEHGLSMDQIGQPPGDVQEDIWRDFQGPRNTLTGQLVVRVAKANMCAVLGAGGRSRSRWILVGRPAATAAAKVQLDYLYEAMERGAKAASNGRGKSWMNDYRLGWICAIGKRLEDAAKTDTVEERGLVLREDSAVVEYMDGLECKTNKTKPRVEGLSPDAFREGHRDGSRTSLAKQLAT